VTLTTGGGEEDNGVVAIHFLPLLETDVDGDPLRQFAAWFGDAQRAGLEMPEAAALATATAGGAPSVRMVLVKHFDERGFVFFSNYDSRKAQELAANPRAALLFHWEPLGRQVRIEGAAAQTSAEESARYVRSRPRGSQLSALASPQSQPVESRQVLEERVVELAARHAGGDLPLPEAWGGFRVTAERYEFWQHRPDRLHDRLRYMLVADGGWRIERLAP
jgi:pyridoxamine 5'-phosphate oxidase